MKLFCVILLLILSQPIQINHPSRLDQAHPFRSSPNQDSETVFICDSSTATKYHKDKDCSGLANCKAEIKEVTKSDAIKDERTECGKCY